MRDPRADLLDQVLDAWAAVLGDPHVGADDDFLSLGGSSLTASRMAARLRAVTGLRVPIQQVFDCATPRALAGLLASGELLTVDGATDEAVHQPMTAPATVQQETIWFLEQIQPGNYAYNSLVLVELDGPLDVARLTWALRGLCRRHELLRTAFVTHQGQLTLRPLAEVEPELAVIDTPGCSASDVTERAVIASRLSFDIERPPLVKWLLYRRSPESHVLAQVEHHFVHDGWSMWLLLRGLGELYRSDTDPDDGADTSLYRAFATAQRRALANGTADRDVAEWVQLLRDLGPLAVNPGRTRPDTFTYRGGTVLVRLVPEVVDAVRAVARSCRATPYEVLFAAYCALVGARGGGQPFAVGTMLRNRPDGMDHVVGMFVNTVALPVPAHGEWSFERLTAHVSARLRWAADHDSTPFPLVVSALARGRDESMNPVFQTCFSMNDWPDPHLDFGPDVEATTTFPSTGGAKFDLDVVVLPDEDGYTLLWRYYDGLFEPSEVGSLAEAYHTLILAIAASPGAPLADLRQTVGTS